MGAYSFKPRFVPRILADDKLQTIRARRRDNRRPKVGELLSLYVGQRTKQCRLLKRRQCIRVQDIELRFTRRGAVTFLFISIDHGPTLKSDELEVLARADGFKDGAEFGEYWLEDFRTRYRKAGFKRLGAFRGHLIEWESDAAHARRMKFEVEARFVFEIDKKVYRSKRKFLTPEHISRTGKKVRKK